MTVPAPLTPADCDLQDFKFMPLDVARLRDSDLASEETPEACWAAVLLWCASWHQVPAASLPDSDQWLAKQAGYVARGKVAKEWVEVRPGALRGWVLCSDGRLYHPVVAEKAIEAWNSKLDQRWRTECGRIKKHNDRHGTHIPRPSFDEWIEAGCPLGQRLPVPGDRNHLSQGTEKNVPGEKPSKRQGERQGQGQGQGQIKSNSEAEASGGKPPRLTDPNEIIFGYGLPMLTAAGNAEKQARSFLGGLRKEHGDEALIDKLRECAKAKPLQPLEWLAAALPPKGAPGRLNAQQALEASNRAVAARFLERDAHEAD